jgi:hypothetical protein
MKFEESQSVKNGKEFQPQKVCKNKAAVGV